MKTAISIPDNIFEDAEKTAKRMGISRSNLFSLAIEEYLQNHNPSYVTEKLDSIYTEESSSLDEDIFTAQIKSLEKDKC